MVPAAASSHTVVDESAAIGTGSASFGHRPAASSSSGHCATAQQWDLNLVSFESFSDSFFELFIYSVVLTTAPEVSQFSLNGSVTWTSGIRSYFRWHDCFILSSGFLDILHLDYWYLSNTLGLTLDFVAAGSWFHRHWFGRFDFCWNMIYAGEACKGDGYTLVGQS